MIHEVNVAQRNSRTKIAEFCETITAKHQIGWLEILYRE